MMCKSTDKITGVCREGLLGSGGIINMLLLWALYGGNYFVCATGAVLFCQ